MVVFASPTGATSADRTAVFVQSHIIAPKCADCRFRPALVKDLLHEILVEYFHDKEYSAENVEGWTKELCDNIKRRLKGSIVCVCVCVRACVRVCV